MTLISARTNVFKLLFKLLFGYMRVLERAENAHSSANETEVEPLSHLTGACVCVRACARAR